MSDPYLGEIKIVPWNFPPKAWALCNGALLSIAQNQALFSILGTTYGGDGVSTFALPDLRGRTPVHVGNGIVLGERAGEATHVLTVGEMPAHRHLPGGSTANDSASSPAGNVTGAAPANPYATSANATMLPATLVSTGGGQAHENMSPYLVVNFIIALQGIYPSRS